VLKKSKKADKETAARASLTLKAEVEAARAQGDSFVVATLEGLDAKLAQKAMQSHAAAHPDLALLVLGVSGDGKVSCCAAVPEDLQKSGVGADDWVRAALEPLGGKGGGKPGRAQGSASGGEPSLAESAARACWK